MPHVSHDLDIYPVRLYLVTSKKQWRQLAKRIPPLKEQTPNSVGFTATFQRANEETFHVVIYIDRKWCKQQDQGDAEVAETAAHEAVHAGGFILDHVGQTYDGHSEPLAYLVSWLTRWIIRGCS